MKRIALATSSFYPTLTKDDQLLIPALRSLGVEARPAIWDSASMDWQSFDAILIRSCWDYHLRLKEFLHWIETIEKLGLKLFNRAEVIRWNCSKVYLKELSERDISIAPTVWAHPDEPCQLQALLEDHGWQQAVIKPTVSATAYRTWLTGSASADDEQKRFETELQELGSLMIQRFMSEVIDQGEWSLVYFDKRFSHAVLKRSQAGDFRVQEEFGGEALQQVPPEEAVQTSEEILQKIEHDCLYARVDGVLRNGHFVLTELELIEPALFLQEYGEAPNHFAKAILSRI